jgi:hypothetical protein
MSNRDVAYNVLRDHPNQWISGMTLIAAGAGIRFGARLKDLRDAGHNIESRRDPSGAAVWEYRLVIADVAPGQETLWAA